MPNFKAPSPQIAQLAVKPKDDRFTLIKDAMVRGYIPRPPVNPIQKIGPVRPPMGWEDRQKNTIPRQEIPSGPHPQQNLLPRNPVNPKINPPEVVPPTQKIVETPQMQVEQQNHDAWNQQQRDDGVALRQFLNGRPPTSALVQEFLTMENGKYNRVIPDFARPKIQSFALGGTVQSQQQVNQANRKQKGTGFTNISTILNANQGAGQRMGNVIGSNLQNQAGQFQQGLQNAAGEFDDKFKEKAGQANQALQAGTSLLRKPDEDDATYQARIADPTAATGFQDIGAKLRGAAYTGPQGLEGASRISSQGQSLEQLGGLARDQSGQRQLLRTMVANRGNYTGGASALDQLLLGHGGQQALQSGASKVAGLNTAAQNELQNAEAKVNATNAAISKGQGDFTQGIKKEAANIYDTASKDALDYGRKVADFEKLLRYRLDNPNATDTDLYKNFDKLDEQMASYTPEFYQQMGLDPRDLYAGNEDALKTTLSNVLQAISNPTSGQFYKGDQQSALRNLQMLQGTPSEQIDRDLAANQFNANVFKPDDSTFGALAETEKAENAYRDTIQNLDNLASSDTAKYLAGQMYGPQAEQWKRDILAEFNKVDSRLAHDINSLNPVQIQQFISNYTKDKLNTLIPKSNQRTNLFDLINSKLAGKAPANTPKDPPSIPVGPK